MGIIEKAQHQLRNFFERTLQPKPSNDLNNDRFEIPTELHSAIKNNLPISPKILEALTDPKELSIQDIDGNTPLHLAAIHKKGTLAAKLAKEMSEKDLELKNNAGQTPLTLLFTHRAQLPDDAMHSQRGDNLLNAAQTIVKRLRWNLKKQKEHFETLPENVKNSVFLEK